MSLSRQISALLNDRVVRCAAWFYFLTLWYCLTLWFPTSAVALDKSVPVADGELRACQIVSIDQAWAVGDRGLILATNDAGKNWSIQHQRSGAVHYAVCFSNEQEGCVLGGSIEPYSHRSVGSVLVTSDQGKTWSQTGSSLPRLIGAQLIGPGHILAWGDWSHAYQSALFESTDGGQTWAQRPVPCGHLRCAASDQMGTTLLVDRTGKIYRTTTGLDFEPVSLQTSPFDPIRFCKYYQGSWWLGGEAGKLYRSTDSIRWTSVSLPGTAADHALLSLLDIAAQGNRVWVVGQPGNVVWTSEDFGKNWSVRTTTSRTCIHSISALTEDVVLTCGPMASIAASRNGGKAWWMQHHSGTRNAVLNISSTSAGVAWDLMAHVTHESKRHASLLVLHDQCYEERMQYQPELAARVEMAGKSIRLSRAVVLPSLPVGNLLSGIRESDLGYYPGRLDPESDASALTRRLVQELRSARPDVIVTNCRETGTPLEAKSVTAIERAWALAGQPGFRVFSKSSGIPEEPWKAQRILVRSPNGRLQFSPSMHLQSANTVLGSILTQIKPLLTDRQTQNVAEKRNAYHVLGTKAVLREPLDGIILDPATISVERFKGSTRLPTVLATSQWFDWRRMIESESGNSLSVDRVWEGKLRLAAKELTEISLSPVLLEIAVHCRRVGDWNRWQSALDLLLEKDPESAAAEAAYWELMMHTGSAEVQRVIATQTQTIDARNADDVKTIATSVQQASPFAVAGTDDSAVQQVSFSQTARRIPIATHRDLAEFTRLLSKWPSSFVGRRTEPRWGWLIASRYRTIQERNDVTNANVNLSRNYSDYWPVLSPQVKTWNSVRESELLLQNELQSNIVAGSTISKTPSIAWAATRPYLDGKDDEAAWSEAKSVVLRDPWSAKQSTNTTLRFARDKDFFYVFSRSSMSSLSSSVAYSSVEKKPDSVSIDSDHIRLRIDLDRDYASWFELAWSATGEKHDACNDMDYWNPGWYVATSNTGGFWSAEIAIPLAELCVRKDPQTGNWASEVWAFSAVRTIPSTATLSRTPWISDRIAADDWFLMDLRQR